MSERSNTKRVRAAYECIKSLRDHDSVQFRCRVLDVAASGSYAWFKQPLSNHAQEDAACFV